MKVYSVCRVHIRCMYVCVYIQRRFRVLGKGELGVWSFKMQIVRCTVLVLGLWPLNNKAKIFYVEA